jgi:hypothetical protein
VTSGIHSIVSKKYIFYVDTVESGRKYMCANRNEYNRQNKAVVFASAVKFIELWRKHPRGNEPKLAFGNKVIWESDYKFDQATRGFSFGLVNPVPLASPVCQYHESVGAYIGFDNGITRTIWLLANGAKSFPVEVYKAEAGLLSEHAGLGLEILSF